MMPHGSHTTELTGNLDVRPHETALKSPISLFRAVGTSALALGLPLVLGALGWGGVLLRVKWLVQTEGQAESCAPHVL